MNKIQSKILGMYLLLLGILIFSSLQCNGQVSNDGIQVVQFNAEWNQHNEVTYLDKLKDCEISNLDISNGDIQKKYKIAIVPTILIFDDGEEVDRFQADLSFKMAATREEIQEVINEIIMNKF